MTAEIARGIVAWLGTHAQARRQHQLRRQEAEGAGGDLVAALDEDEARAWRGLDRRDDGSVEVRRDDGPVDEERLFHLADELGLRDEVQREALAEASGPAFQPRARACRRDC